ncbi:hypothetical protein [Pacificibacter marinus]|uniref:Uncharacterized protein n=1 Tax=Pacificibacter marinus TaxID=658057 RepID=A0A1Y5TSX2_9RHOB|nr:hypothetical protein [Pacificibacter marinus]SEL41165.1 hypothetical protein SAMN04488032_1274 [Pacificibacter marinus]SLN71714.1 hypothetical protein PAM7971_03838 [Pacificibacter marinus]
MTGPVHILIGLDVSAAPSEVVSIDLSFDRGARCSARSMAALAPHYQALKGAVCGAVYDFRAAMLPCHANARCLCGVAQAGDCLVCSHGGPS